MRLFALAVLLAALPSGAAQSLTWEVAGDTPIVSDGPPIVRADGSFWIGGRAPATESPSFGVLALPSPHGPSQHWTRPVPFDFDQGGDAIVTFGPDTLFTHHAGRAARSIDDGATFTQLPAPIGCNASFMIEMLAGLPHAGRLLCGSFTGSDAAGYVTYSDDRGDSWTAAFGPPDTQSPVAHFLEVVRTGSRAGRVVAAGAWGLATSDDGGATWQPTTIWQYFRFYSAGLATLAGGAPGGGDRIIANVNDPQTGIQNGLFVSDDGGDTWTQIYSFGDNANDLHLIDFGGGSAVAVFEHGNVRWTADGGVSWDDIGTVPYSLTSGMGQSNGRVKWAWQGPDGRLYVGGSALGAGGTSISGYTWRTAEPLAVAGEASPEPGAVGVSVSPNPSAGTVRARVTLASPSESVMVEVFDAVGRRVVVLHESRSVGAMDLDVDASAWAPGIYTMRVTAGGAVAAETFTVVR